MKWNSLIGSLGSLNFDIQAASMDNCYIQLNHLNLNQD